MQICIKTITFANRNINFILMELINDWKERAKVKGITLEALCEIGGIDSSTLQRWKLKLPKAVRAYLKIEAFLNTDMEK